MTAASNTLVRISTLLLASAALWVGAAEAKSTGEGEAAVKAATKKANVAARESGDAARSEKEPESKKTGESDVIANLDNLGQSGVFDRAKKNAAAKKRRRRRARARNARGKRQSSPGLVDLFQGDSRNVGRPTHGEVGYTAGNRLSSGQVGRVMRAHRAEVANCFLGASRRGAAGKVVLHLGVAADGKVTSVKMNVQGANPRRVRRCLAPRVRSWSFPETGAANSIEFPFAFGAD